MNILLVLIPLALGLGGLGLGAFLWSLKSRQYSDLDGASWRALHDDADEPDLAAGVGVGGQYQAQGDTGR